MNSWIKWFIYNLKINCSKKDYIKENLIKKGSYKHNPKLSIERPNIYIIKSITNLETQLRYVSIVIAKIINSGKIRQHSVKTGTEHLKVPFKAKYNLISMSSLRRMRQYYQKMSTLIPNKTNKNSAHHCLKRSQNFRP